MPVIFENKQNNLKQIHFCTENRDIDRKYYIQLFITQTKKKIHKTTCVN